MCWFLVHTLLSVTGNSCIIILRLRDYRLPVQEVFDVERYVYFYYL